MTDEQAGRVFSALADPTRRRLLSAISATPATATQLAGDLPITRQAVTKHLSALADAGLLKRERVGRDIRYRVTPEPLTEAASWMAEVGGQWDRRLASLRHTVDVPPARS
jgi:DNA-binding transcriptional ArsR family regulator